MTTCKRLNYFRIGLVLCTALLLLHLLPASSLSQNSGGGGKTGGPTMLAISGKVVETMNSGGYTYALVQKDGDRTWVALPKSRIAVDSEITCQPGMVMNNFSSPSLNRTFKQIVFSRGITASSGSAAPQAAPSTPAPDEPTDVPKIKEPENWKDF